MKKIILACTIATASISTPAFAEGEAAVTGGFVSDYYYRGSYLGTSSAYLGAEYERAGLTAGIWGIKDGSSAARTNGSNGVEYDIYLSYNLDVSEDTGFSLGLSQYNYDYTSDYEAEINLGATFGAVSVDVALGTDENPSASNADFYYRYASANVDVGNFNFLLGRFTAEDKANAAAASGDYSHAEISTSKDLGDTDAALAVTLGHTETDIDGDTGDTYIVLDLSVDFDL